MKRRWIYLLFLALLVSSVSAQYYPYEYEQYPQPAYQPKYGYGGIFGFGTFDFDAVYDQYHLFVDAIIYGLIFFGLGAMVFKKPEQKPLYIGLGLFMTAALLLFEARSTTKFRLLDIAGPWAVTILIAFIALMVYEIVKGNLTGSKGVALTFALLTALWLFYELSAYVTQIEFLGNIAYFIFNIPRLVWFVIGVIAVFVFWHKRKVKE